MKAFVRYLAGLLCAVSLPLHAEVSELRITKQPSFLFLPAVIMEHDQLIEKHARAMGLGKLNVQWVNFTSGGAATDALMSGKVDIVSTGLSNLLLLLDRTHGAIKGISGMAVIPEVLVTRNPRIKSIRDFSEQDRIALPTVKVSNQAILLKMAADQLYGPAGRNRLDPYTVAQGHPDATIALLSGKSNIDSHFSAPPYQQQELKNPAVHQVVSSKDIAGDVSTGAIFTSTRFHDGNPKVFAAFLAALHEAESLINQHPRQAARKYLEVTHEKYSADELARIIRSPDYKFTETPYGTMKFAEIMYKDGQLKNRLASWKDAYFPEVHHLPGN